MQRVDRVMPKPSDSPLQPNPFLVYRNPTTGEWLVIDNSTQTSTQNATVSSDRDPNRLPFSQNIKNNKNTTERSRQ